MSLNVHKLSNPTQSAQRLTQSVIQVTEMFAMYQAELARILCVTCADIGLMASGKHFLVPDSKAWQQAIRFVRLYELLYETFNGNEAAICHWLRAENPVLNGIPLYLMVDSGRLVDVVKTVECQML